MKMNGKIYIQRQTKENEKKKKKVKETYIKVTNRKQFRTVSVQIVMVNPFTVTAQSVVNKCFVFILT